MSCKPRTTNFGRPVLFSGDSESQEGVFQHYSQDSESTGNGVSTFPVAIIEYGNGSVCRVRLDEFYFTDGE